MEFRNIKRLAALILTILFLTSIILLMTAACLNLKYNKFKSDKIKNERILYEQIAYEIYTSIKSEPLLDIIISKSCENNYRPIEFNIKLDPRYNYKYNTIITHLFNVQFCAPIYKQFPNKYNIYDLKYKTMLKHSININNINDSETDLDKICEEGYKPCGILDTMNNILCFPKKYNCPLNDIKIEKKNDSKLLSEKYKEYDINDDYSIYLGNNISIKKKIIIDNYLSTDKLWDHEWKELIGLQKYKKSKDKKKRKELKKREEFKFENYDKFMELVEFPELFKINLSQILIWEKGNESFHKMANSSNFSDLYQMYHKNYIGFKNYDQFSKFIKIFNQNDYSKNPIYKISNNLYPYIATIVFVVIDIISIIIDFYIEYSDGFYNMEVTLIVMLAFVFIYFFVYISLYFSINTKFIKLQFEFDEQIQKIFDLYSKRRKQDVYLSSIIILIICFTPYFIGFFVVTFFFVSWLYKQIKRYCDFCFY